MSRYLNLALALSLALAPLSACAVHEAKASPSPRADDHALCVQMFQRARACTDTYIPALVDARARHDQPAGIAEAVRNDRDGVIAQAKTEWASDSTDQAISETCSRIVADDDGSLDPSAAQACLSQADCAGYTTCIMPVFEKHFAK